MSRLSIRPRPLDIHKKLPVVKSIKEFDDDGTLLSSGTRNSQLFRLYYNEVNSSSTKKPASEIPTPQFVVVDTYERDYTRTFVQPTSYLRGRGARAELGEFVEYDLDNEDEDWIEEYNKDKIILAHKEFESILFKLDVFDHKTRERAGVINQMLGSPVPVLLTLDAAIQALQFVDIKYSVFQSIYNYWKEKRERWQKPVLRCVQPPPPSNDTNPYNVFRPREKTHRLHTRRMQRRENNVQSFEKLRLVRRNFEQAKTILEALIKREEKKRDVMECEVSLQRKLKYKHETKLVEDSFAPLGCTTISSEFVSSEEEFLDSDDVAYGRPRVRLPLNMPFTDNNLVTGPPRGINQEFRRHPGPNGWLNRKDPEEPVLLFTRPLIPEKMVEAGIDPPSDSLASEGAATQPYKLHGRIGRGGRIVFDRWNPLMQTPAECNNSYYVPPKPRSAAYN